MKKIIELRNTQASKTGLNLLDDWKVIFRSGDETVETLHHCSGERVLEVTKSEVKDIPGPLTVEIFLDREIKPVNTISVKFPGCKKGAKVWTGTK